MATTIIDEQFVKDCNYQLSFGLEEMMANVTKGEKIESLGEMAHLNIGQQKLAKWNAQVKLERPFGTEKICSRVSVANII